MDQAPSASKDDALPVRPGPTARGLVGTEAMRHWGTIDNAKLRNRLSPGVGPVARLQPRPHFSKEFA